MEGVIGALLFYGGAWWVGKKVVRRLRAHNERRRAAAQERESERQRFLQQQARTRQHRERLNRLYGNLQVELMQLDRTPDFRRAASKASAARDVPVALRRRQYHRFRSRLIQHFGHCLRQGVDGNVLTDSLVELLEALGVAAFEADYIRQEAERRQEAGRAEPSLTARLEQLQREHEQRLAAFEQLRVDPEIQEQLVESEMQRFQEQMLRMTDPRPPRAEPIL